MVKVLVVDDDPDFVEITRMILELHDVQVSSAMNGEQALAQMRKERPDLVILDVMMSSALDGWYVSQEMQEDAQLKDIPIIMVSSIASSPYADLFPTDSCPSFDAWISKPVEPDVLLKAVRQCLPEHSGFGF
ncbi:MAG: response regulator [Anaerolineae bacterium]|jgi:CheY-like chemotaxis protein|nr:response regulator [Anaerolineae bacterium]